MEITELLDALAEALSNRNRSKDSELTKYWIDTLKTHIDMLEEIDESD